MPKPSAPRTDSTFPREAARVLMAVAAILSAMRLLTVGYSLWDRGREAEQHLAVIDAIPRGAQLLTFRTLQCGQKVWPLDWRLHLGGYALARKGAFANDQWQIPGAQLLRIHNPSLQPYMTDPSQMQTALPCGKRFVGLTELAGKLPPAATHIWVIWDREPFALPGLTPIARSGLSVVYRREGPALPY